MHITKFNGNKLHNLLIKINNSLIFFIGFLDQFIYPTKFVVGVQLRQLL